MTIDIDAIRQREQAASRAPWRAHTTYPQSVWLGTDDDPHLITTTLSMNPAADAEFIAHARTDVPALLAKVDELTAELDRVRADERNTIAADIEDMPINLGDAGWKHLETKADEASYPTKWVRRRRTRDDFTTATIEVAYQYGYRQAAKVARGEVAR